MALLFSLQYRLLGFRRLQNLVLRAMDAMLLRHLERLRRRRRAMRNYGDPYRCVEKSWSLGG